MKDISVRRSRTASLGTLRKHGYLPRRQRSQSNSEHGQGDETKRVHPPVSEVRSQECPGPFLGGVGIRVGVPLVRLHECDDSMIGSQGETR